ncbi:MAG TPA: heat-shock protein [Porphyromonadaceae bacterium]|jgi:HSP20 family protein|uniref:Hsp20/alpha crystallin family protein n=1 Tax=Limibacterium fermenti TaxID=3229863 RepID=UPI000E9FB73A|nr:heat-shock protein [Porphyromonadaceae bacterium]HBK30397.1 heat-shock protein [Porphyromonadaceae bacterium]HBL34930.1 heat-shock protein [Porphyromonadaceae bacterium]HBX46933.1 heat-shock protein [Porphyromonadaceae bacterium]
MALIRRTNSWLPSIFNDFFGNEWMESRSLSSPAINIQESDKGFSVEVAVPGMTKQDCNVTIDEDNNLLISVEKKTENEEKDKDGVYLRREFSYSQFQRRMLLPDNIEKDHIAAKVEDGVLKIEIPKSKEEEKASKVKQIAIQ